MSDEVGFGNPRLIKVFWAVSRLFGYLYYIPGNLRGTDSRPQGFNALFVHESCRITHRKVPAVRLPNIDYPRKVATVAIQRGTTVQLNQVTVLQAAFSGQSDNPCRAGP